MISIDNYPKDDEASSDAWAERFMEAVKVHPGLTSNREMLSEWFANAIVAGYRMAFSEAGQEPQFERLEKLKVQ